MADNIYDYLKENFNILTEYKFKRDYIKNPLHITNNSLSEIPYREDLFYMYKTINLSQYIIGFICGVKRSTVKNWIKKYDINKNQNEMDDSRKITCRKKYGYDSNMCTSEFKEKSKKTKEERYNNSNYNNSKKRKQTKLEKYGNENYVNIDKMNKTNKEKYGVDWIVQSNMFKEKFKDTSLKKYGVIHPMKNEEIKNKSFQTQLKSGIWGKLSSKPENKIYDLLLKKYNDVKRQYKSGIYPFRCDFYIPSLDLFIEYQGYFGHGNEPYVGSNEQIEKIKIWKSKNSSYYNKAINDWTIRDVLKRETAKKNKLNWIEFFNIEQFMEWYNKQ